MYILYLDESGTHGEASYFVLAGLAVFEREIHWFTKDLDSLQTEYFPKEEQQLCFRVARLRTGANDSVDAPWDSLEPRRRRELKNRIYEVIRSRKGVLFGCAIEKRLSARSEEPYERAFEDLVSRFDLFLGRVNQLATQEGREEQRGIVVLAESSYRKAIALLARRLQARGTRWRELHNVTDVPFFAPAGETRLLQYADFCVNAIYGRYHAGLTGDFDRIAGKFDVEGNVVHGLAHLSTDPDCVCLACFSRRARPTLLPVENQ